MAVETVKVSSKAEKNGAKERPDSRQSGAPSDAPKEKAAPVLDDNTTLTPTERKMVERLSPIYVMFGGALSMWGGLAGDPGLTGTGSRITELAEEAAQQWVILARSNSTVKRWIERIVEGVGLGGLVAVHAVMLLPLLAARGVIPPEVDAMAGVMFTTGTPSE